MVCSMGNARVPETGTSSKESTLSYERKDRTPWRDNPELLYWFLGIATVTWTSGFAAILFIEETVIGKMHLDHLGFSFAGCAGILCFVSNLGGLIPAYYLIGRHRQRNIYTIGGLIFHCVMLWLFLLGLSIALT